MIRRYLITDPLYYTQDPKNFLSTLSRSLKDHSVDFALYRDKRNPDYETIAQEFVPLCKRNHVKPILHQNYLLAQRLGAYGVHLLFSQRDKIKTAKKLGLFVIISTHTEDEIQEAVKLGVDAVVYSPIFETPNKGIPKGLAHLKEIVGKINTKIIALGGITTDEQVKAVESCGVFAYASIRKFIKA